jgi:hypothetical protein
MTEARTAAELEKLIMDRVRGRPECANVLGVTVTAIEGSSGDWTVGAIARDGASTAYQPEIDAVVRELRRQYHLIDK